MWIDFAFLFICGTITIIESLFLHTRYVGRMKRGIPIGSEPLSSDMKRFFRRLHSDIVDEQTGAFIKKQENTILVQPSPTKNLLGRNFLLRYIAYADLRIKEPKLEYRIPISVVPFSVIFIAYQSRFLGLPIWWTVGLIACYILVLLINHRIVSREVQRFIEVQMQTS